MSFSNTVLPSPAVSLPELPTPSLVLDLDVLERNLAAMAGRARRLGVALRPHAKTHKCVEVARLQARCGARGLTVATLEEARAFAEAGFGDLTWAFPVVLGRLDEVGELAERVTLRLVVDSGEAIDALEALERPLHVWLKVDCGYHRAGVDPASEHGLELARRLASSRWLRFDGLLSHSGHAYHAVGEEARAAAAEEERSVMAGFAERLRAEGVEVAGVSVGSTPATTAARALAGITEIRPGNYALYDLTQVALGSCRVEDCAATVLASVVSHQPGARHSVVDAGALALSKDPGAEGVEPPTMGRLLEADGRLGARLLSLSQEHGVVEAQLRVGARVRIVPNHSCLAVACFDTFVAVRGAEVVGRWTIHRQRS